MSLDGYIEDEEGSFDWAAPDAELHTFVKRSRGAAHLWVPNIRPRCLACGFASESGGRRCRCQPGAACSTGERHAGGRSASCVDNRSVPEAMRFREACRSGSSSVAFRGSTGAVGGRFPGCHGAVLSVRTGQRAANVSSIGTGALHRRRLLHTLGFALRRGDSQRESQPSLSGVQPPQSGCA